MISIIVPAAVFGLILIWLYGMELYYRDKVEKNDPEWGRYYHEHYSRKN